MFANLQGVFAAAITPLNDDFSIDFAGIPRLLDFLAGRGCDGALLFGTTGEGPSFAPAERLETLRVAVNWRKAYPDFHLLAGSGTPSLQETIELTQAAFDLGIEGVVTLPPYYFRKVQEDGLFAWFSQVIDRAVPHGGALLGYHFPNVSGVPLSLDLLARLKEAFPEQFVGIKDSSGEAEFAHQLGESFGEELVVLTGNDRLFSQALANHAAGCITAMANLYSPELRQVWTSFQNGDRATQAAAQATVTAARAVMDRFPPFPPLLKALFARQHAFPRWTVRPPLLPLPDEIVERALKELYETD
jgi:4-hydroxy-tetrahydrodipicolinate synthase